MSEITSLKIPKSVGISVIRIKDDTDTIWLYNPVIEFHTKSQAGTDITMMMTQIISDSAFDACTEAVEVAVRFSGNYIDDILLFDEGGHLADGEQLNFTVSDVIDMRNHDQKHQNVIH
jgi:hypothetical protein